MNTFELEPLPEENVRVPQENAQYFARKRYVRKDKFTLRSMLRGLEDDDLPSIASAFQY